MIINQKKICYNIQQLSLGDVELDKIICYNDRILLIIQNTNTTEVLLNPFIFDTN